MFGLLLSLQEVIEVLLAKYVRILFLKCLLWKDLRSIDYLQHLFWREIARSGVSMTKPGRSSIYILLSSRRADSIAVISSCHSHASANSNLLATRQLLTRQMLATDLRTALTFCRRALGRFSTRLPWGVYTTSSPFSPTSFTFFSTK